MLNYVSNETNSFLNSISKEDRKKIKDISKKVQGFNLTGKNNNVKDIE